MGVAIVSLKFRGPGRDFHMLTAVAAHLTRLPAHLRSLLWPRGERSASRAQPKITCTEASQARRRSVSRPATIVALSAVGVFERLIKIKIKIRISISTSVSMMPARGPQTVYSW